MQMMTIRNSGLFVCAEMAFTWGFPGLSAGGVTH
jgi:hypothetical protein